MVIFTILGYVAVALIILCIVGIFFMATPSLTSAIIVLVTFLTLMEKFNFSIIQSFGATFLLVIVLGALGILVSLKKHY